MKSSTERQQRSSILLTLAGATVLVASVACRNGGLVEAPMISVDASASAGASRGGSPPRGPRVDTSDMPFKFGDRWVGWYLCNQGRTDLVLTFDEVGAEVNGSVEVGAVLEFHFDGNGNPGYAASDGSSRMRGTYEVQTRRLRLKGEEWIEQPANYRLVSFAGAIDKATGMYTGSVDGPGCSSFRAMPEASGAARDPRQEGAPRARPPSGGRP